jgi:hypothetical protein
MRWDSVRLNLPGASNFDPRLPRVLKWCEQAARIAGDVIGFMDDERGSGHSLETPGKYNASMFPSNNIWASKMLPKNLVLLRKKNVGHGREL